MTQLMKHGSPPAATDPIQHADVPGHPPGVTLGCVYTSREALAAARIHTSTDRPVALVVGVIHVGHMDGHMDMGPVLPSAQVTSVVVRKRGGRFESAAALLGSCMLKIRLPHEPQALEV